MSKEIKGVLKKKINDVEYTFQRLSAMEFVRLKERAVGENGQVLDSKLFQEIAEHIIVEPRVDLEAFGDYEELKEIMETALRFQLNKKK